MKKVVSTCIYCGCGCKLNYHVENNKIVKISGNKTDDISDGLPCIKGLTINEVFNKNRIQSPYIREKGKLVKTTWQKAIDKIYKKIKSAKQNQVFLNGSGKITNENNLLLYKLGKLVFNTNNIDSCCGRLCHISTVKGVMDCFGSQNLTSISSINKIDTLFIIGSNPASNYPVFWNKITKRKNLKLISVQPLQNLTSQLGKNYIQIEPGTETALLNAIINYIIQNNSFDKEIEKLPEFKKLKKITQKYNPEYVSKECKIKAKQFLQVCKTISNSKNLGVFHGMGFTQHVNSMDNIYSLLNLVILKNALILTLRGEINVQGVGDVFSSNIKNFEKLWQTKIKPSSGNIVKSFLINPDKIAFITEFDPAQSLPNLNKVHKDLEKMFIIYLGSYFNLTCNYADVILPIPALFESTGTITNGEQRIRFVNPVIKTKNPSLLEISKMLAKKFNKENLFQYQNHKQIFKEITQLIPEYKKLNPENIYNGNDETTEKTIKFKKLFPVEYKGKDDVRTKEFNLILTTFREKHQFLTGEITTQSKTLNKLDKDKFHLFISPLDAKNHNIKNQDKIKITSKIGSVDCYARISNKIPQGLVGTRYHYKEMLINKVFPPKFDKITFTPNYKCVAVKVEKII